MNLTPSSNAGIVAPTSQDPQGGSSPLSFEQYRSPLVTAYNGLNYATLQSNNGKLIFYLFLLQVFSSEPSEQSGLSSHIQVRGTHSPGILLQENSSGVQTFDSENSKNPKPKKLFNY